MLVACGRAILNPNTQLLLVSLKTLPIPPLPGLPMQDPSMLSPKLLESGGSHLMYIMDLASFGWWVSVTNLNSTTLLMMWLAWTVVLLFLKRKLFLVNQRCQRIKERVSFQLISSLNILLELSYFFNHINVSLSSLCLWWPLWLKFIPSQICFE